MRADTRACVWRGTHLRNDAVEAGALVSEAILAGGKLTEVASGLRDDLVEQFEDDPATSSTRDESRRS